MDVLRDLFSFLARLIIGVVFIAHGLQKFLEYGVAGTARSFGKIGIPLPTVAAWYAALVEVVGGVAFIIGVALPLFGVLLALNMAGALYFVHLDGGLIGPGGAELVLILGLTSLALGFSGGRWSLDHAMFGRRRKPAEESASAA